MTDLAALESLLAAATPGPWNYDYNAPKVILAEDGSGKFVMRLGNAGTFEGAVQAGKNMDLLLALRNSAESLIETARREAGLRDTLRHFVAVMDADLSTGEWEQNLVVIADKVRSLLHASAGTATGDEVGEP